LAGEGALGAAFIPIFTSNLQTKPRSESLQLARRILWDALVILGIVAALGVIFSRQVIYIFTLFGASGVHWELAVSLNRVIFPCVIFVGLAAVAAAILNSFHLFTLSAATPIFFNLAVIVFSFTAVYKPLAHLVPQGLPLPAVSLALGVLVGSALQFGVQVPALARRGVTLEPSVNFSDDGVRRVGRLMGPGLFGACVYQINFLLGTMFATSPRMPSGSVASLYIAERLMQLVLGSYAIAISTVLLPTMSHQAAAGNYEEMKRMFDFSLRIVSFITVPAAVGLMLLRGPIIQVLFQHGQFAAYSTALTANALVYYSLGLPAYAAMWLITPMYYSTQDTRTPARIGAWMLAANVALNALFLAFSYKQISNGSPALASSICAYLNFAVLFFIFRARHGRLGARNIARSVAKIAACTMAMAAVAFAGELLWRHQAVSLHPLTVRVAALCGLIITAVAVYLGLARLLRCQELNEFVLLLRRAQPGAMHNPEISA